MVVRVSPNRRRDGVRADALPSLANPTVVGATMGDPVPVFRDGMRGGRRHRATAFVVCCAVLFGRAPGTACTGPALDALERLDICRIPLDCGPGDWDRSSSHRDVA